MNVILYSPSPIKPSHCPTSATVQSKGSFQNIKTHSKIFVPLFASDFFSASKPSALVSSNFNEAFEAWGVRFLPDEAGVEGAEGLLCFVVNKGMFVRM